MRKPTNELRQHGTMFRVQVLLDREVAEELQRVAAVAGCGLSEAARMLLRAALAGCVPGMKGHAAALQQIDKAPLPTTPEERERLADLVVDHFIDASRKGMKRQIMDMFAAAQRIEKRLAKKKAKGGS